MAKIVSPVWSSIRGSIAGITYLTTPSGAIIGRQRVKPVNPSSPNQTLMRSSLVGAVADWGNLSAADRQSWDNYALAVGYPTGRNAFIAGVSVNNFLTVKFPAAGLVANTNPPVLGAIINISNFEVGQNPGLGLTGINVSGVNNENEALIGYIEVSAGFAPTRNFWRGPWDSSIATFVDIAANSGFNKAITGLTEGLRYFVRFRAICKTGPKRTSSFWISNNIAVTGV